MMTSRNEEFDAGTTSGRWFHGTFTNLNEGDTLRYGEALGGESLWEQAKPGQVYFTNHLPTARQYADAYTDSARKSGLLGKGVRSRVYEVHPTEAVEWDENEGADYPESRTNPKKRYNFKSPSGSVKIGKLVEDWSEPEPTAEELKGIQARYGRR